MPRPALYLYHDSTGVSDVPSLEEALSVLAIAASLRLSDEEVEHDRLTQLANALSAARAASAALQMWAAQCLSEYRGSRTTWDLQATSDLLAHALLQFETTARETAGRLAGIVPIEVSESAESLPL